jgi:Xaa-Pro aminopeptidase
VIFAERRKRLLSKLKRPLLLFSGGLVSRNYPANPFPFRADSTFMYFFDRPEPNSAALLDPASGDVTLFLPERTLDDALWHGPQAPFAGEQARHGVTRVEAVEKLEELLRGKKLDTLAVADARATRRARALTGADLDYDDPAKVGPPDVLQAIAALRLRKDGAELAAMAQTAKITREAHVEAIKRTKPGVLEQTLLGIVEGTFAREGCVPAYGTILSARGEVLHSNDHSATLQAGDIVLLDGGAEGPHGYCSDVTRCWPVGGPFTQAGRDVYDTVLEANLVAIAAVSKGMRSRELHLISARVVAEHLKSMGLLKGAVDGIVETGAHAVFYPHGVGHPIGLDVHDLETFGDAVLYPSGRTRSPQFGTKYLRWDVDLDIGMTFTIEPGVYFVPAILHSAELRERFKTQVDFDKAEGFLKMNGGRGFGGVRIEDDVLCTQSGPEVLTKDIPKAREDIERLVGTA